MLKAPVKIEQLMEEWANDCVIDKTELGNELNRISLLHAKYVNIYTYHKKVMTALTHELNILRCLKHQYFHGDLNDPAILKERGWEPIHRKILRADIPTFLEADKEIIELNLKIYIHKEIADYCTSAIKQLNDRNYALRSSVDWEKFIQGK